MDVAALISDVSAANMSIKGHVHGRCVQWDMQIADVLCIAQWTLIGKLLRMLKLFTARTVFA